ncbi:UDP-N-acetylglucosamine acyltransferase [Pseudomonas sp. RIT-To-2]|uniref:UDP-N-acetylglucosamine acyltransferase n=1 Tax=Pseudomonas sp. RIT-To-2 TaxID=3462541 RepID=UPI0024132582
MKAFLWVAAVALMMSGCTSAPPTNFSLPTVEPAVIKQDAELKAVSVSYASPKEQTGDIPTFGEGFPLLWEKSLEEAINKSAVFQDDASEKVNLFVKVKQLEPPLGGISMTTSANAEYTIVSRKTGKVLYQRTVFTKGVVPGDYAFSGMTRMRESLNRAVQNNIAEFLDTISHQRLLAVSPQ